MKIEIDIGNKVFSFSDFADWVNTAQESFYSHELNTYNSICVDSAGRICKTGSEFARARKEGTFPIDVYSI